MPSLRAVRVLLALVLAGCLPAPAQQPQLVLVSIDGFRWDYLDRPEAVRLRELAARGVRAERMIQVFPTKTFATHYSMVTGLHPGEHGILANNIWDEAIGERFTLSNRVMVQDSRWWGGEPIWVAAERAGLRTAPLFWPGSEAEIQGIRPSFWRPYDGRTPNSLRVRRVLDLLADSAVSLATLYFSHVDDAGHTFGPDASQTSAAIASADSLVGMLVDGLAERGLAGRVNLIVVSDHGMAGLDRERVILLDRLVDLRRVRVVDWSPVLALIPDRDYEAEAYRRLRGGHPNLQVYRKGELPERFHYNAHPRVTPIVALADEGWTVTSRSQMNAWAVDRPAGATHGWDPEIESMGALFVAAGPAFRQGAVVPRVRAIDLYALMAGILGLTPAPHSGSLDSVRTVLRDGQK